MTQMLTQDAKRGRMDVDERSCQCHEMVSCEYSKTIDRTKKNIGGASCTRSIFWPFLLSVPAYACQPTGTMPASSHGIKRSNQSGRRRAVLAEDKKTHLRGFAVNRCLFVWTKPRRGAQATVASDSVMASFQRRRGHGEKDGALPSQHCRHICKQTAIQWKHFGCLKYFGNGVPSREQAGTGVAPCQAQNGRCFLAPQTVQTQIVAEGWNQSQKCIFKWTMRRKPFPSANST